ncbi:unnamed protein product, partial [Musa acuminata var. zebrina]
TFSRNQAIKFRIYMLGPMNPHSCITCNQTEETHITALLEKSYRYAQFSSSRKKGLR